MRLFEIATIQYRNHYVNRSMDEMRMFERPPKIIHSPFIGDRSPNMPRSTYAEMIEKPWIIEIPTANKQWKPYYIRYSTENDAIKALHRMLPDENEKIGYEATKNNDWVGTIEKALKHRGYEVSRSDAISTNSKYLTVILPKGPLKIRFSDHSKMIFLGSHKRNHSGDYLDFSTNLSKPAMIAKTASLLKSLDIASGK